MIVVIDVSARREHGGEALAGSPLYIAQEALLFRQSLPAMLHRAIGFPESGDLQRKFRAADSGAGNRTDAHYFCAFLDFPGLQTCLFRLGSPGLALRGLKKTTAATRQRDEGKGADEIQTNSTRHARESPRINFKTFLWFAFLFLFSLLGFFCFFLV